MSEYIDRAALKQELAPYEENDFSQQMDVILAIVDTQPTADVVEVRHGRWEKHPQSNEDDPVYTCSLCKLNVSGFEKRWIKYCPNCSALMQEEDNGEK